jgi:hypothetical protein
VKVKVGDLVLKGIHGDVGMIADVLRKRFVNENETRTFYYALVVSSLGLHWYCEDELRPV